MKTQHMTDEYKAMKDILASHESRWEKMKRTLGNYKASYENNFWGVHPLPDGVTKGIQTSHVFSFIEQFVSAIFLKYPSIEIKPDPTTQNSTEPIEAIANRWLSKRRSHFEDVTRQALLYPSAFMKMYSVAFNEKNPTSILESIHIESVKPWDIIVDIEADSWDKQRYIGHVYYKPYPEVLNEYGKEDYKPSSKHAFFKDTQNAYADGPSSDQYKYVKIVEFYDKLNDKLIIWTPDHSTGFHILDSGEIPIRDDDDEPMIPILPLYLSWDPDLPLVGLPAVSRIYDKVYELNHALTHRNASVKRNARKYIADKTHLSEENILDWESSEDGTLILAELNGQLPDAVIRQVTVAPLDVDFNIHIQELRRDLDEASTLPVWARGQTTGDTATEVSVANAYAENELGKMARQKDELFERVCELYIRLLYTTMEEDLSIPIEVNSQAAFLTKEQLAGSFTYVATDGGASPGSLKLKGHQLLQDAPALIALGANQEAILEEVVRLKEYSATLLTPKPEPSKIPSPINTEMVQNTPVVPPETAL